jgi:hypothetical protein
MNVPVHESKVTNAQSGVEPQAYFEGASVDPTEAGCASRNRSRCLIYDPTLSTDRIHRQDSGWLGIRLKPNDRPAARVCGNRTLYVEAVVKR